MSKPEPCKPTSQQLTLWEQTRAALIWHCPAFTHILYSMLDTTDSGHIALFTKDVPVAATDGSSVLINPDTFFKYNLPQRVFVLAHEILHCVFDHCGIMYRCRQAGKVGYPDGSSLPYDQMTMNVAMDLVINDMLIQDKIGEFVKEGMHDPSIATHMDSVLEAYRKVYKHQEQGGDPGGGGGGTGFDQHLDPGTSQGKDPSQAVQDRNPVEWDTAIAEAANAAKAQGKLPAALGRAISEILDPKVDWREHIQALFNRRIGGGSYDWKRPDRRLIVWDMYAPGRSGFGAECVVVACDTSGSVGKDEINMFFAELSGILEEVRPRVLYIVWCDAYVHRVDLCDNPSDLNVIRSEGAPGGGGTAFEPVFEWVEKEGLEPDALVYLTDGMGSFPPKAPNYPVIWGNTYPNSTYPFGDVVELPTR